jgi:hypothetical protein
MPPFNSLHDNNPDIYIPRLLHHDPVQYTLIIEDLGNLPALDDWLETTKELSTSGITSVATKLGMFIADFHVSTNSENRSSLAKSFKNDDMIDVVFSAAVQPILAILQDYNIPNAEEIYKIVTTEFRDVQQDVSHHVVNLGDLWTGSILVNEDGTKIGIIDWEFAMLASPSQDMGQFGLTTACCILLTLLAAHLHHRIIMDGPRKEQYQTFAHSVFASYGKRVSEKRAEWLVPEALNRYLRSIWIIHGRELINSTTWEKRCPCEDRHCPHNQSAIQKGVDYILAATRRSLDSTSSDFLTPIYNAS